MPSYSVVVGVEKTYSFTLDAENASDAREKAQEDMDYLVYEPRDIDMRISVVEMKGLVGLDKPEKEDK